jgi:glyceraldehyde 3-phosphate dehydrogenase
MAIKVGINGFGRIGRLSMRTIMGKYPGVFEVVAINDLFDSKTNAYLFKYDTNYGIWPEDVSAEGNSIKVGDRSIKVFAEKDPAKIPWGDLGVEMVLESTGVFTDANHDTVKGKPGARAHIDAGAKKVVISAPAKNEDITIVLGVNQDKYDPANHNIVSNASCTTNCLAPVTKVLNDSFGIDKGLMTTVHAYTNDQRVQDQAHSDLRRSRAAAENIILTSTGAAKALHLVVPELKGKLNGYSLRVPTSTVSVVDLVLTFQKSVTAELINEAILAAANGPMKGYLGVTNEPLVSVDFKGDPRSSIVDATSTMVIGDNMAKVIAWYDNEWGYASRVADLLNFMAEKGL